MKSAAATTDAAQAGDPVAVDACFQLAYPGAKSVGLMHVILLQADRATHPQSCRFKCGSTVLYSGDAAMDNGILDPLLQAPT